MPLVASPHWRVAQPVVRPTVDRKAVSSSLTPPANFLSTSLKFFGHDGQIAHLLGHFNDSRGFFSGIAPSNLLAVEVQA